MLMRRPGRIPPSRGQSPGLTPVIGRQQLDDLVDDYVSWREACAVACTAYDDWNCASRDDRRLAFSEYLTALDREEEAARLYQRTVERLAAMTPA
jgi:Fe-S-cluster containining protein